MKFACAILILALAATGCTTSRSARLAQQNAFLAGQNQALRQQLEEQQQQAQQAAALPSVTIIGPVQNSHVPWVAGLTLAQAIATANYLDSNPPAQVVITRNGESATISTSTLINGPDVPLESGDIVELRQQQQ
jgi:hypothetical protein